MKSVLNKIFSVVFVLSFFVAAVNAQTQLEMNGDAADRLDKDDKNLNRTFQMIIKSNKENRTFISQLRLAEKAWITYRDAYLRSIFPTTADEQETIEYGSAFPMCRMIWLSTLTTTRTTQLREFARATVTSDAAKAAFLKEEAELNQVYQKVLRIYPKKYLSILKQAELKWLAFRDADTAAFMAQVKPANENLKFAKMADRDRERTKELKQWVEGIEEGDICIGCIRIRS